MTDPLASPTVRDNVLHLLRSFGMTTIFGNPGSTELPMFRNFPADFRYVLGLQEAAVVGMADGWAQATRGAACINLHSAAGVGNAMGNIFTAFKNQTPLLITAGQQARSILPFDPFLYSMQASELAKPYVKWSCEPARAQDVPLAMARAYYIAMTPPCGPVLVSVPADDWDQPCEPGGWVERDGGWDALIALAERHQARVWTAPMSPRNAFPESHPLFGGFLPAMCERIVANLAGHDFILVLGAPAFTYHVEGRGPHVPEGAELALAVDDPQQAAWAPLGTAAVGSLHLALQGLLARPARPERPAPPRRAAPPEAGPGSPMSTAFALQTLQAVMGDDAIVVEEAPGARGLLQQHLRFERSGSFYTMASGGLGHGMPAAVGMALGRPGRRVIALVGDGSAMYSPQAVWTAQHLGLPVTFVILNNRRYAALQDFASVFGFAPDEKPAGTELPGLDFVALARGMGCAGVRVSDARELADTLRQALRGDGPLLVELMGD
ncbi:MAG: Benzoylformate decarboxylase [Paracidovorax wautersii]|uniref:Benzoylformate decarboxylase n=1 Tax=Paracidovorax wautersii TaxID=1177982 RepID=A0A7V8FRH9_9BURK|nr:MAG: Benzoylformate decarboxylase [Paracidovorax wautersii]